VLLFFVSITYGVLGALAVKYKIIYGNGANSHESPRKILLMIYLPFADSLSDDARVRVPLFSVRRIHT